MRKAKPKKRSSKKKVKAIKKELKKDVIDKYLLQTNGNLSKTYILVVEHFNGECKNSRPNMHGRRELLIMAGKLKGEFARKQKKQA